MAIKDLIYWGSILKRMGNIIVDVESLCLSLSSSWNLSLNANDVNDYGVMRISEANIGVKVSLTMGGQAISLCYILSDFYEYFELILICLSKFIELIVIVCNFSYITAKYSSNTLNF